MTEGRSVQRLFRVTPPLAQALGARGPAYGGEYYTPTLRLVLWHAFQQHTRGTRPSPVRPNHPPARSRVQDPKLIPRPPGTTGGPGSSLSDICRISLQGKGPRREGDAQRAGWEGERGVSVRAGCLRAGKREKRGGRQGWRERERHGWRACTHIGF